MKIKTYITEKGKNPFNEWIDKQNKLSMKRIYQRLRYIQQGNLGDYKNLKGDLFELRFFFDSGLRVYFTKQGEEIILLLCGGNKKTQQKDIQKAREYIELIKKE